MSLVFISLALMNWEDSMPGTMMKDASDGGGDSGIVYHVYFV